MTIISGINNWVQFNSHQNQCFEDEEDTLSLSNLPTNDHEFDKTSNREDNDPQDFDFASGHTPENMCNADEVFFQGQILPIQSNGYAHKPKVRNQFHSHPSPSPQIRTQSFRTFSYSKPKTTSLWSLLQVGLVKPQEIGLSDLKNRSKRSGSHNSSNSNNSSSSSGRNSTKNMKKKQRLFLSGCDCSPDSVERKIMKDAAPKKTRKEENMLHVRDLLVSKERTMNSGGGRHAVVSRHRTREWLGQLSIAAPSEA